MFFLILITSLIYPVLAYFQIKSGNKNKFQTNYTYGDESRVLGTSGGYNSFWEGVAWDDGTDITAHYDPITDTSWIWGSPSGYPLPYNHEVYTFAPRGYSGLEWAFSLSPSGTDSRTFVLAGHRLSSVLNVRGDSSYRLLRSDTASLLPAFAASNNW